MVKAPKVKKDNSVAFVANERQNDESRDVELTPKQKEILKQRDDVEELVMKGYSLSQIAVMLSLNERTVDRRVAERRAENLKQFQGIKKYSADEKIAIYQAKYTMIERKLWSLHASTEIDMVKVMAIKQVMDADDRLTKRMQMLGYLPKDNQEIEDTQPLTVIWGSMKRPDVQKQLENQRKKFEQRVAT